MSLSAIEYTSRTLPYDEISRNPDSSTHPQNINSGHSQKAISIIEKTLNETALRSVSWTQEAKDRFKKLIDNGTPLRKVSHILTAELHQPFTFRDVAFYKNKLGGLIPSNKRNESRLKRSPLPDKPIDKHAFWTADEKETCQKLLDEKKLLTRNKKSLSYKKIAEILTKKFRVKFTTGMIQYYSDRYASYQNSKVTRSSQDNVYIIPPKHPVWKSIKLNKSYTSIERRTISPLNYVGNKNALTPLIWNLLPNAVVQNKMTVVSPFAGSMPVELTLAMKNIKVIAGDAFKELCNFWKCLFEDKVKLARNVQSWIKKNPNLVPTQEKYNELRNLCTTLLQDSNMPDSNRFLSATYFFILNKVSLNALGLATQSGLSKNKLEEFSKSEPAALIQSFRNSLKKNISIEEIDYKQLIGSNPEAFLFLDPPYWYNTPRENRLYGVDGELHKNFKHEDLHNIIKTRNNWLLCYNDCPKVRDLYKGFTFVQIPCKRSHRMSELLILSHDLAKERTQKLKELKQEI